jgi:Flp pilus assembly protein CpaB
MSVQKRPPRRRAGHPFIVAGAVLGVLTAGAVIFYTSTASGGTSAGNVPVVVAAHDLLIRVPILPGDLAVAQFHASDVPPGSFSSISQIKSVLAAINISKGQAVTGNLIVNSTDAIFGPQTAYLPIPSGFVALTIPTGEQAGVAGYIQVGDYLSMVAIIGGKTSTNIRTIYTNIPVIRIGTAPSAAAPVQGSSTTPPQQGGISSSLTIVVTQCQAEFLSWFLSNGTLRYTLESYHDYKPQDVAVDPSCPDVNSAKGVTQTDISSHWPGILS